MKGFLKVMFLAVVISAVGMIFGCQGKHKLVSAAPDWVNRGSGAFEDEGEKVFYGVGAVTGISSQPLAVRTADQRARADIAKQLDTYVANLYRDYQTSTAAAMGKQVLEEQHVEESLKTFTQVSVHGARVMDHWKEPETNTIYSLVRLNLEGIKATLEQMKEIDPALRGFVRSNAEKAFDEIRQEEKRR
jgi:hypothetical protein